MSRLLRRTGVRHLLRHPGQLALTVLGVAMGVAVVVSIDLAVQSARQAFRLSTETVAGRATHQVEGGPGGLDETVHSRLVLDAGVREAAPVVEGWASSPALPGRALRVLGVDPLSEGPFRSWLGGAAGGTRAGAAAAGAVATTVADLLTRPFAVVLSAETAREAGVAAGDALPLDVGGRRTEVTVAGVLEGADEVSRQGLRDLVVTDIAWGQELLGMAGRLSRVDLRLPDGPPGDEALARIEAVLPGGVRVRPAGARTELMADMIRAFDLNLTALSLLALVFGTFLIYNALTFSVVQRRETLGVLRALGVTRGEVVGLVLGEAAVVGLVGSAAGLLMGIGFGRGLVRLVTRTINDLYFVVSVESLALPPGVLAKGAALGMGATLLAAVLPAREAANTVPRAARTRSVIEERWRSLVPRTAGSGTALVVVGTAALLTFASPTASFAALFALVLGMALLTPAATVLLMRGARPAADRVGGILGTLAARGVVTTLSRTAPAIAALVVAVSVTVGLGVMIASFRGTVAGWLEQTLQADVYVSAPSAAANRPQGTLDPRLVEALVAAPGVAGASTYRGREVDTRYGPVRLLAADLHPRGERAYDFREGEAGTAFREFRGEGAVLVSEPFAYHHGLGVGSQVWLPTPAGERPFHLAGIFYDYGSERGVVMMARSTWDEIWDDTGVTSLALFLEPGAEVESAVEALRARAAGVARMARASRPEAGAGPGVPLVEIRSNRTLREASLEVFDRTFAVTSVLRALAFGVAFIGVLSALMALQLERSRELGVLRANGMTPGQVWKLVTAQTGLMGATAGLLALPVGLVLAVVMVHVVNKRSFGWTLRMELGPEVFLQALGLALGGALLAGVYPAWRMARTSPSEALREE